MKKEFTKAFYKKQVDDYFAGLDFFEGTGIDCSMYIKTAEAIERLKRDYKKQLDEAIDFWKDLKKKNPEKYSRICNMMGWDDKDSYPKKEMIYADTDSVYIDAKTKMNSLYGKMAKEK